MPSASAPEITVASLPGGTVREAYKQTLTATGTAPIRWTIASGALPAGLSLNTATGVISGTPTAAGTSQKTLDRVTAEELKRYAAEGHFAAGSMLPKVEAVVRFMESGGREAVITNPESLSDAVSGNGGTHVVP